MCQHQYVTKELSNLTCSISDDEVPHDKDGFCIFHSESIEFKKQHRIVELFKKHTESIKAKAYKEKITPHFYFAEYFIIPHDDSLFQFRQIELDGYVDFRNAKLHYFTFTSVIFSEYVNFNGALFSGPIRFVDCIFQSLSIKEVSYDNLYIEDSQILNQFIFVKNSAAGYTDITNCTFNGYTLINDCEFEDELEHTGLNIQDCIFNDDLEILDNHSDQEVRFHKNQFNSPTRFIDFKLFNRFSLTSSIIKENFLINSTYEREKLFNSLSEIAIEEKNLTGILIFENINYLNLSYKSRIILNDLELKGKVKYGKGVLKYRVRSEIKKVKIKSDNQEFVVELGQVFSHFFIARNGLNLGIQIYERTEDEILFYYFSEDDIDQESLESIVDQTELVFWDMLLNKSNSEAKLPDRIIKTVDILIDLASLFLKISTRIPFGRISEKEINNLLSGLSFRNPQIISAKNLMSITINNTIQSKNQKILLGINNNQKMD